MPAIADGEIVAAHIRDAVDNALAALPQPENRHERDRWRIVSRAALYAAAPLIAAAERERIRSEIPPARLRLLADWFDTDDEFKTTTFPETWPHRDHEVQDDLRRWADLLEPAAPDTISP